MTAGRADLPGPADVDVAPAGEPARHRGEDLGVGLGDAVQGLVGEDDAEAGLVVLGVALPERDLPLRRELLGQGGEVQTARPSPDDCYPHERPPVIP